MTLGSIVKINNPQTRKCPTYLLSSLKTKRKDFKNTTIVLQGTYSQIAVKVIE